MTADAALRCRCGQVEGRVARAAPMHANRVICYCADCQAFLHHLGRADLLDTHGGSDIIQVAPAALSFHRGDDRIAGLRLTARGLYRFYASCCHTPLGNTVGPAIPFIGIVAQAFAEDPDAVFGKPTGAIYGRYATGPVPDATTGIGLRLAARAFRLVLGWRLTGQAWPNPFFDHATRAPNRPVTVLSAAEREALRLLCGPQP